MTVRIITSDDNPRVRLVRKLSSKRARDELGKFVAEGENLVSEAVSRGAEIDYVLVSESYDLTRNPALTSVRTDLFRVPDRLFDRMTDAENGVRLLAVVNKPETGPDRIAESVRDGGNLLVLDRVQDPGNIGTLIRTAAAAGYRAVVCIKGTGDVFSPKVLRATAGLIYAVPVLQVEDASAAAALARSLGKKLAVTVPSGGTRYDRLDLRRDIALVIGNEGRGVSDEIMSLADILITIPMAQGVESLNASVSGSIVMYEAMRQE